LTQALAWPDGSHAPQGDVVILAHEDGIADTVRPRIDRQGGDASRVHLLRGVRAEGHERGFSFERDLVALEQALVQTRAIAMVVDPISAYLGRRDSYKDSEIRGILAPLAELAERHRVAIIAILHLTKAAQRKVLLRAQGSVAFVAQARTVLAVAEDREMPGRRLLVSVKNNLGPTPPALAFRIGHAGLTWEPGTVEGSAEQLLAVDEAATRSEQKERDQAVTFLRDLLRDGAMQSKQVMADAVANGVSQRTLWRAKAELGILAERTGGRTGAWYWMLPAAEAER
jgi:RecA-family ATPase